MFQDDMLYKLTYLLTDVKNASPVYVQKNLEIMCFDGCWCGAEVVYAAESRKEIIPLTVEPRFNPDGWLKFHMSDRLRLDFSSESAFHNSIKKLIQKLQVVFATASAAPRELCGPAFQYSRPISFAVYAYIFFCYVG